MNISFPNPSRSFDSVRNAVRFFGHDGLFEIRFFVEAAALADPAARGVAMSEEQCLSTFDTLRASILEVARRAYCGRNSSPYTLKSADFA